MGHGAKMYSGRIYFWGEMDGDEIAPGRNIPGAKKSGRIGRGRNRHRDEKNTGGFGAGRFSPTPFNLNIWRNEKSRDYLVF